MYQLLIFLGVIAVLAVAYALARKIKPNGMEEVPGVQPFVPSEEMGVFGTRWIKREDYLIPGVPEMPQELADSELEQVLQQGEELLDRGQGDAAVEKLLLALTDDPGNPDLLLALGGAFREVGLPGEAVEAYEKAKAALPGDVSVLLPLAEMQEILGDSEKALATYREILSINPDIAEAAEGVERLSFQEASDN